MTTTTRNALVLVQVRDRVNPALAGHDGCEYTSPPHERDEALALGALLLGCPTHALGEDRDTWTTSIAGGRRTITLTRG